MAVAVTVVAAGVVEVANMIGERELDFELSFISAPGMGDKNDGFRTSEKSYGVVTELP